jgi:hypothetical protein
VNTYDFDYLFSLHSTAVIHTFPCFFRHTGLEGRTYHPPNHVTDHQMRMFVLEVIREAHTESRRKHHAHMEHKHGSKGRRKHKIKYHPEMEL